MSFAPRTNRPESKDVVKLRREFDEKAARVRAGSFSTAQERDKAQAEKRQSHEKLVEQIAAERGERKRSLQKVLIDQGSLKSKEQHQKELDAAKARAAQK